MEQDYTYNGIILFTLFGAAFMQALAAGFYLLLRSNNAFVLRITPSYLRRWTAVFCFSTAASLLWWLLIRYSIHVDDVFNSIVLCSALDIIITFPAMLCTMLAMLQDRRRPLWPVVAITAIALCNLLLVSFIGERVMVIVVFLNLFIIICVVAIMLTALRQYHRWLLDNYAELEHKEVWQTFLVLLAFLLITVCYILSNYYFLFEVLVLVADITVIFFLLWRTETMPMLEETAAVAEPDAVGPAAAAPAVVTPINIERYEMLLNQYCVDAKYYLEEDLSLRQLAKRIGTNSNYLSQYFASQGLTYNSYINKLRIEHFISLYEKAAKRNQNINTTKLSRMSGFSSYSTFGHAFKSVMGQSLSTWMLQNRH